MIDEREDVTYPDGVQAKDSRIHIIYDHQRTPLGEVLMATFTEEDARASPSVTKSGCVETWRACPSSKLMPK